MIDIHCHILPGVDDGALNLEMSVGMARLAAQDGIRVIVATPHHNKVFLVTEHTVRSKVKELQTELDRLNIPLTIMPGNELRLESPEFVYEAMAANRFCYLADNPRFVLLEQSWEKYHPDTPSVVAALKERGTTLILPHPERHFFFRERPKLLEELVGLGVWTQVSVDSLIGNNGPEVQKFALSLVDRGLAHTLATDAHNLRRKPNLSLGYKLVAQRAGAAAAEQIRGRMKRIIGEE
ncbi:tyrosine-protein phosphatase [Paenibacillus thermotolerans]|uniref:tyrosine-protein phosphatase n=1 Tax=Paenibacillus thermotolerans TaxID=3027807 RepID=UPI002367E47B|nr:MULTISPECIES: CpsB/CapC family capsule biosynthesis tyrosine phosphatase [unclassified Paenibacillus]